MRIALHNSIGLEDANVTETIRSRAALAGFADTSIVRFNGSIDLADELAPAGEHILDVVIAPDKLVDSYAITAITKSRERLPLLYAIVVGTSRAHAANMSANKIDGYVLQPVSRAVLERELDRAFDLTQRLHRASFVMNASTGEHRIPFHAVMYCETSGHDQVVHLEDGNALVARYSSQGLFDLLSRDKRFFKVGSSYIVNLNEIAEADPPRGTLTLSNGTTLTVPVRVRKHLGSALLEWH